MSGQNLNPLIHGGPGIHISHDGIVSTELIDIAPDGFDQTVELRDALNRASTNFTDTNRAQIVVIGAGTLYISSAVEIPTGVILSGVGRDLTRIEPYEDWSPSVSLIDSRDNYMLYAAGIPQPGIMNTILTTAITPGGVEYYGAGVKAVSVSSTDNLTAGDYFTIEGHETGVGQNPGGTNGSGIVCCEILQASSIDATVINLQWPTLQHHVTTNGGIGEPLSVKALEPCQRAGIANLTISAAGKNFAVGLRLDRCLDFDLEQVGFEGFGRNAVDAFGCAGFTYTGVYLAGGNSGGLYLDSCLDGVLSQFSTNPHGERYNRNSTLIRSAIRFMGFSTCINMNEITIRNMCSGIKFECFRDIQCSGLIVDNLDIRPKTLLDSEEHCGIAIDEGAIDLTYANYSSDLVISGFAISNCRADPTMAVVGGIPQTYTIWLHDVYQQVVSNGTVYNTGVSPYTTIDGDDDYWMPGIGSQDCSGYLANVIEKGVEYGLGYHSSQGLVIDNLTVLSAPGGSGTNPVIGLWLNPNVNAPLVMNDCNIQNGIYFGSSFVQSAGITLNRVTFDSTYYEGPCMIATNTSGAVRVGGDTGVVAMSGASKVFNLPTSTGEFRQAVVTMPAINTVANNGFMFVQMTGSGTAQVTGTVEPGDLLVVTNGEDWATVDNAATAYQAFGKAIDAKGAAVGPVRYGSV